MSSINKWLIIGGIVALLVLFGVGTANGNVGNANNTRTKWSDVQSAYQRRMDLVNQTLPAVIGASAQELAVFKTLKDQAAALAGSFKKDQFGQPVVPQGADAQNMQKQIAAFDKAWINAIAYTADNPEIKSTELFANFMVQVEGSENRVNVARRDYNAAVNTYRNGVQMFPGSLIAGIQGMNADQFPYFQAEEGAQTAPKVVFPTPAQ